MSAPRLKKYSTLTDEILDLGPVADDNEEIDLLELGSFAATGHPDVIVFVEGKLPPLQKWEPET